VNFINLRRGDEGDNIRLLTSFQKQFPYKIKKIHPIRGHVYKVETTKGDFILKGYSSYSRLKLQETFTSSLQKEGFNSTYAYIKLNHDPIFYRDKYFGCMTFIEPHHRSFTYVNEKERHEGLHLLSEFHQVTKNSVQRYQTILPAFDLKKKWTDRLNLFLQNVNVVSKYVPGDLIFEWVHMAEWSLEGINKYYDIIEKETPVILHGDVAHHNFLRGLDGKLFLIDFDLITIGPRNFDLLQFANRILPFINWNMNVLIHYKSLKDLLSNNVYVYALAYPTDIFREWNRIIREDSLQNGFKLQQVMNQSLLKMNQRQQFVKDLTKMVTI
jgi:thiamine kinase-like enzyme